MARLDGRPREICELRYRAGLSPARIAEVLGMQPNTVSKALQRAREELRDCIERRERVAGGLA
jgi:RNA polymerase sigma-70 factor (ECF subfamily)